MEYRVEEKYICDAKDLEIIRARLKMLMQSDENLQSDGNYRVKSLYFDDYQNSCMNENEDGVNRRNKYRIRYYNNENEHLKLEVKNKKYHYVHKYTSNITSDTTKQLLNGSLLPYRDGMDQAYSKFYMKSQRDLLKPVIIVDYLREVFVCNLGNVRITLDKNICASKNIYSFLEPNATAKTPILGSGKFVLEVKYDEFLPRHIYHALGLENMQQTPFSKYYLSRLFLKSSYFNLK